MPNETWLSYVVRTKERPNEVLSHTHAHRAQRHTHTRTRTNIVLIVMYVISNKHKHMLVCVSFTLAIMIIICRHRADYCVFFVVVVVVSLANGFFSLLSCKKWCAARHFHTSHSNNNFCVFESWAWAGRCHTFDLLLRKCLCNLMPSKIIIIITYCCRRCCRLISLRRQCFDNRLRLCVCVCARVMLVRLCRQ